MGFVISRMSCIDDNQKITESLFVIKNRAPFCAIALLCTVLFFLVCMLLFEYNALLDQHYQLEQVKREYRQHMWHMKQLRDVYVLTVQRVQYLESLTDRIKDRPQKDIFDSEHLSHIYIPKNNIEFDNEPRECDEFIPLNRDLEYLKHSTYEYLKKYNRDLLLRHLYQDTWRDYTQVVLSPQESAKVKRISPKKLMQSSKISKVRTREAIFSWPIDRSCFWLSSAFGRRTVKGMSRFHHGIDMAALKGTPVKAAASGVVIEARNAHGYGNTIVIRHNKKYKTRYAHLNRIRVCAGQKVRRGQRVGDVGDTGFVHTSGIDASHLHFEVSMFGERVNPQYYLV